MWTQQEEIRSDDEIQSVVKAQFLGVAPERRQELEQLWEENNLCFSLLADGDSVEMEGGLYRHIRFNHRALRVLWVSSFAAWEAYRAYVDAVLDGKVPALSRLNEILECARSIRTSATPDKVSLPDGIPEPGVFPDGSELPELRAASELAVFISGWAMLHEVRHVLHQREGTSTTDSDDGNMKRQEELSCDAYATTFILSRINEYVIQSNENQKLVERKRKTGIIFAMFALTVMSEGRWNETDTHPSMQARIDLALEMCGKEVEEVRTIAACAFGSLKMLWKDAPSVQILG